MSVKVYMPGKDDKVLEMDNAWPIERKLHQALSGEPFEGYIGQNKLKDKLFKRVFRFLPSAIYNIQVASYRKDSLEIHKMYNFAEKQKKEDPYLDSNYLVMATGTGDPKEEPLITMPLILFKILLRSHVQNRPPNIIREGEAL